MCFSFIKLNSFSTGDYTMLVCPGIGNTSQSVYIRTFVDCAQRSGYRVSVLNHLGALPDEPLTSPRLYTYGSAPVICRFFEK